MTKDIQKEVCKAEILKGNIVSENFHYFFVGEFDVISANKNGYISEFEVKVGRRDFKADALKYKWGFFEGKVEKRIPNYFSYVCPEGLIKECDLKYDYMGLIYMTEAGLLTIKKPKLIHKYKHDLIPLYRKMLKVNNWMRYFGASQMTIKNQEIKNRTNKSI